MWSEQETACMRSVYEHLVVLESLSADEMYSDNLFSIRTTLIQALPCRERSNAVYCNNEPLVEAHYH